MELVVIIRIMKAAASCSGRVAWVQEAPEWVVQVRRWSSVVVLSAKTMEDSSVVELVLVDLEVCLVDLEAADQATDLRLRIKALSRKFTWAISTRM